MNLYICICTVYSTYLVCMHIKSVYLMFGIYVYIYIYTRFTDCGESDPCRERIGIIFRAVVVDRHGFPCNLWMFVYCLRKPGWEST